LDEHALQVIDRLAYQLRLRIASTPLEHIEHASQLLEKDEERLQQLRHPFTRRNSDAATVVSGDLSTEVERLRIAYDSVLAKLRGSAAISSDARALANFERLRHFLNCLYASAHLCEISQRNAATSFVRTIFSPAVSSHEQPTDFCLL
jgi:hypothetical protein